MYDINKSSSDGFNYPSNNPSTELIKGAQRLDLDMNPDGGNTDFEAKSSDSDEMPQNILNEPSLSIEDNRNNRVSQQSRRDLEITDPNSQLSGQKPQINPYLSTMFKEKDLLSASNAYHRLDKSQHFLHNRAYA